MLFRSVAYPADLALPADFGNGPWVVVTRHFEIEGLLDSRLIQIMPREGALKLVEMLLPGGRKPDAGASGASQMADNLDARNLAAAIPHVPSGPMPGSRQDSAQDLTSLFAAPNQPQAVPQGYAQGVPQGYPQGAPQGYPQMPPAPMREPPAVHPAQFSEIGRAHV